MARRQKPNALDHYSVYSVLMDAMREGKLTPREVLLATIIHHLDHSRDGGQYCYASNAYMGSLLGAKIRTISAGVANLEEQGFLRIVSIDPSEANKRLIESLVMDKQMKYASENKKQDYGKKLLDPMEENCHDNNKKKSICSDGKASEREGSERKRREEIYRPLSERLLSIIQKKRKVVKTVKMFRWDDSFRGLIELDGVPMNRVDAALKGYAKIIGDDYVPEAWSARAFREKFERIEAAIKRSEKKKGKGGNGHKRTVLRPDKPRRRIGG